MAPSFEFADDIIGFIIDENADNEFYNKIHHKISSKIQEHGSVNLYCEIKRGFHLPFKSFVSELSFKIKNSQKIHKMACVTEVSLFRTLMEMNNLLSHTEIQTYEPGDRIDAINWISE